jgi:hypothetical protein
MTKRHKRKTTPKKGLNWPKIWVVALCAFALSTLVVGVVEHFWRTGTETPIETTQEMLERLKNQTRSSISAPTKQEKKAPAIEPRPITPEEATPVVETTVIIPEKVVETIETEDIVEESPPIVETTPTTLEVEAPSVEVISTTQEETTENPNKAVVETKTLDEVLAPEKTTLVTKTVDVVGETPSTVEMTDSEYTTDSWEQARIASRNRHKIVPAPQKEPDDLKARQVCYLYDGNHHPIDLISAVDDTPSDLRIFLVLLGVYGSFGLIMFYLVVIVPNRKRTT